MKFLITNLEKKYFILIFLILLLGSFLETISIAIFLPLLNVIFGNSLNDNFWMENFNKFFNLNYENISIMLLFIIALFIIKNFLFLISLYVRLKIINYFRQQKKYFLLKFYLNQNYFDFIEKKKSELLRNIYNEVDNFTENFILPIIELIYISLILISVFVFLLIFDTKASLIILLSISVFSIFFYFLSKKKLLLYGFERAKLTERILKKIPNALNGFMEIKLFNLSQLISDDFIKYQRRLDRLKIPQSIIGNIPRVFLEILVVVFFSLFLLYNFSTGTDILPLISKVSIFIIVIIKILPFINSISNNYNRMMRGFESYKILKNEFSKFTSVSKKQKPIFGQKIVNIVLENLSFKRKDDKNNDLVIFDKINLSIKLNNVIGIIGPSGSGKTTLLKIIIGLLKPNSGSVKINGIDLQDLNIRDLYKKISYIPQEPFFLYDTIKNNIISSNILKNPNDEKFLDIIKEVKLDDKCIVNGRFLDEYVGENASNLSGGEKQRLALARAFYRDCDLLIFDEVTNKLDNETSEEILKLIYSLRKNKILIMVSHDLNTLKNCDYILELKDSKIKVNK